MARFEAILLSLLLLLSISSALRLSLALGLVGNACTVQQQSSVFVVEDDSCYSSADINFRVTNTPDPEIPSLDKVPFL